MVIHFDKATEVIRVFLCMDFNGNGARHYPMMCNLLSTSIRSLVDSSDYRVNKLEFLSN